MADHADEGDEEVFIYRGGRVPQHITHARIDKSIDEIEDHAFEFCEQLLTVDTHNGLRKIGTRSFYKCMSLRQISLKSVVEIGVSAFYRCENLEFVEFDRLETIRNAAFGFCTSLKHVKLPTITTIGAGVFGKCECITDIELSERLQMIGYGAIYDCKSLQRIAIPLKRGLFVRRTHNQFGNCEQFEFCDQLATVDIVGGIHKTVASLHMKSWRTEMIAEINRINQVLPNTRGNEKANEIQRWMDSVIDKMDHYKENHRRYVKEGITLLELALWKAKLGEKEESSVEGKTKKAKIDAESARKGKRITCGADMVIKNVLPFLQLE